MRYQTITVIVALMSIVLFVNAGVPAQDVAGGATTATRLMPASPSVSQAMLDAAGGDTKNWLHPNGSYEQMRYYAGAHIHAGNVGRIKPAFVFQTAVLESMQTAPIVVDGVMFLTTSFNHVYAIDAATGEEFWRYRHQPGPNVPVCCGNDNRGVAIAGGRLFMGTHDARLVALDARTGKVQWERPIAEPDKAQSATMAPTVVDGKVLIGADGGAQGMRGFVKAFDAADGSLLWTFHTIADKGHEGVWAESDATGRSLRRDIAAEKKMLAEKGGEFHQSLGGGMATTPAVDRKTRTVFLVVGSPAPAFHGAIRPGDNLYTDSIVAIDLDKGTYKWHFQYIAHDVWNLGAVSPPILTQARDKAGKMVDAVIHGGKTGHVYVHERSTGRLIRISEPMIPQENLWAPPTIAGARMLPGANGGVEWSPLAVNPKTRLAYAANLHQPMTYHVDETPYPGGRTVARRRVQGHPRRRAVGPPGRRQPRHRQSRLGREDAAAADRRGARHGRQPGIQWRSQWLVQGVRRDQRQGALEVQLRRGRQRAGRLVHGGRQAICCCRRRRQQPDRLQARQQRVRVRASLASYNPHVTMDRSGTLSDEHVSALPIGSGASVPDEEEHHAEVPPFRPRQVQRLPPL